MQLQDYEISKLKKQLQRSQEIIDETRRDLEFTENKLIEQRDRYHAEIMITRDAIENVDKAIAQKIEEIREQERKNFSTKIEEFEKTKRSYDMEKTINQKLTEENQAKEATILELSNRLRQLARRHNEPAFIVNPAQVKENVMITNAQFYKLTEKYNKLCADTENIVAENRILRRLHGVPENFGFDLEEIKIAEKQELEDYKTQVKHLEAEVEELEAERTQLRYRLRQFNTLYSNKGQRYKDFTPEQFELLDAYAMNLKEGRIELPQIDKSKKEMEKEIIKLRAQIEILQRAAENRNMMNPNQPVANNNNSPSGPEFKKYQEEIKSMLQPFLNNIKKIADNNQSMVMTNSQLLNPIVNPNVPPPPMVPGGHQFMPPAPLPYAHNDWSKINEGFSYTFNAKIPIEMKDLYGDVGFDTIQAKYEVAALQLQNIENMKLLREKESIEKELTEEINYLKDQYKKCLNIQDDLFLKHFSQLETLGNKIKSLQNDKRFAIDEKDVINKKLDTMQDAYDRLLKNNPSELQSKLIEQSKRLALSESELLQMQRKYKALSDEQKSLRHSYTTLESKASEIEHSLRERLLQAKKNERMLTLLLNSYFDENKDNVSSDAHNIVRSKLEIVQDKYANTLIKEAELRKRVAILEGVQREVDIKQNVIDTLNDDNTDLNLQLEIFKARLSSCDSNFRKANDIFMKFINYIKVNNVSLVTFFKKFDTSQDGLLSKDEMGNAFNALGFRLSPEELSILFSYFDLDGSDNISYKQFLKKVRRAGVTLRTKQQQSVYKLYRAIQDANFTLRKAFNAIDKDGSNTISKGEMESALLKMGISINAETVQYIFKMCDNDGDDTINYSEFEKLFENIVSKSEVEEKTLFETELDWKYAVMLKIEECARMTGKDVMDMFQMLDKDGSRSVGLDELNSMFTKVGAQISRKNLADLFGLMDKDGSRSIGYDEFLNLIKEARKEKERVDRIKFIKTRAQQIRKEYGGDGSDMLDQPVANNEGSLKLRLTALETKQKHFSRRQEMLIKQLANRESEIKDLKQQLNLNEKTILKAHDDYYSQKKKNQDLQERVKGALSKEESETLKAKYHKINIENVETKAALDLYKGLFESLINKSKSEHLKLQKIQSQKQKFYELVKQLEGKSDANAVLGSLTLQLEQSKWNEGIANQRYDKLVDEMRAMREENARVIGDLNEKEMEIVNVHKFLKEKDTVMQRNLDAISAKILPTVTLSKVEQLGLKVRQISNAKSELQEANKKLRQQIFEIQLRNDYLEGEKSTIEQLEVKLRKTYDGDLSQSLIDLSKKLSEYKMTEMRCKREVALMKEKEEYYMRINHSNQDAIKEMQNELASWQIKFNQREEFWRKKVADQVKITEAMQEEHKKQREQDKHAALFLAKRQEQINDQKDLQRKLNEVEGVRKSKLASSIVRRPTEEVGQQLSTIMDMPSSKPLLNNAYTRELEDRFKEMQAENEQLKMKVKEYMSLGRQVPQLIDYGMQGSQIMSTSINLQTDLTASQLKNNAHKFIANQKHREQFFQEQSERLAKAAQQSIETLQRIIDDKNDQLKRKDKVIQDLKRDYLKAKEQDTLTIQQLNEQLHREATREISVQPVVITTSSRMENDSNLRATNKFGKKTDEKYNELLRELQQKDRQLNEVTEKYEQLALTMQKKGANNAKSEEDFKRLQNKIRDLQNQREIEMKKFENQQSELKKRIVNLEKLSKEKDVKLAKLNKSLVDIKKEILGEKAIQDKQFENGKVMRTNVNDGQLEQHLQKALDTIRTLTKEKSDMKTQIQKMVQKSKDQDNQISRLKMSGTRGFSTRKP